jgi:hypothetical protein
MRSTDLTREQLERIRRQVDRQLGFYLKLWRRAQANDMPLDDPFVLGICRAWEHIAAFAQTLERMEAGKPHPYRPLAKPTKNCGLASVELPWAEHQRRMAEARRAERKQAKTPRDL